MIGFALVGAAYTLSNFGQSSFKAPTETAAVVNAAPARTAIEVVDENNNGIEDWRDDFVTTDPLVLEDTSTTYTPPDTLTGQLGINFFQDILSSRTHGAFARSDEEIIGNTIEVLRKETGVEIYDTPDIKIIDEWTEDTIRTYANALALAITTNDAVDVKENELYILQDILNRRDQSRIAELDALALTYQKTRDDTLKIPVPAFMAKQHLDLINTYHAIQADITAMTYSYSDPAYTLLRLKRYEEDATGLYLALQNIYKGLEPYASLFTVDDPAVLFVVFSPNNQSQI